MKLFETPKEIFLVQKPGLILKYIYGQEDKITPEAGEKGSFFDFCPSGTLYSPR